MPTLTLIRGYSLAGDPALENDPRLRYVPAGIRQWWRSINQNVAPDVLARGRQALAAQLKLVGDMHQAGVPILAGTDTPNPYCLPGFGLHDELGLLVEAGLTPFEALQSATISPARHLRFSDRFGTIEAGKLADPVLLDADPLVSIGNTMRINSVVMRGRLLARADLDRMLSAVEAKAALPPAASARPASGGAHAH